MVSLIKIVSLVFIINCFGNCDFNNQQQGSNYLSYDSIQEAGKENNPGTLHDVLPGKDTVPKRKDAIKNNTSSVIETGNVAPAEVLNYAKTLIGVPYLYASTDPAKGFDCSGFITNVFNHFNISVPRSSVDFTNVGTEVPEKEARPGDLILFTGTDSTIRVVGHMGIVESNNNGHISFIHSTSGKAKGVVITPFERYYRGRFVKFVRLFPGHFFKY